ncbi:putative maltase-glucoamylase 2 [Rhynchocyon petersi]
MARKLSVLEVLLTIFFVIVLCVAVFLLLLVLEEEKGDFTPVCTDISDSDKIDCAPGRQVTQEICTLRFQCCWKPVANAKVPKCFFPKNTGYEVTRNSENTDQRMLLRRLPSRSRYGNDIEDALFRVEKTSNRFHFKIIDANNKQYEVQHESIKSSLPESTQPQMTEKPDVNCSLEVIDKPFSFKIRRTSNSKVLLDTSIGPLLFAQQYLQLSFRLPSANVYGLGEHVHQQYRHDMNWRTWPIFTQDHSPRQGINLYGAHPFFLCLEDSSGASFGVLFMNSNAMEVTLQPAPAITYRAIGGILDFYVFLGNTPEEVIREYLELVGKPFLPPYWSLGFQLSRRGYANIQGLKDVVTRTRAAEIPHDVQYSDIDYMDGYKDFTLNNQSFFNLPGFVEDLHSNGQKYVVVLVGFKTSLSSLAFPTERKERYKRVLDNQLFKKTLCMDTEFTAGLHYDVHNVYGHCMSKATVSAMEEISNQRKLLLSRSTFVGSGKFAGHWLGDNMATWEDLKWSIPSILEFNLFGIPLVGANICGYEKDTTEELCRRWMQVGAFYPLSRNHNGPNNKDQDPASFGENSLLVNSSRHYLNIRYTLLPYLYTLFYRAHTRGDTVARPLVHEFYQDPATWDVYEQFLWGPALLIIPVLHEGEKPVKAYIPDAIWYDFETMETVPWRKQQVQITFPPDKIGLFLRGGYIFPIQYPNTTTEASRKNPLGLIIALDHRRQAKGELYWDDGVSNGSRINDSLLYEFSADLNGLQANLVWNYTGPKNVTFTDIIILGMDKKPENVTAYAYTISEPLFNGSVKVLHMRFVQGPALGDNFSISWVLNVHDEEKFNCYPEDPHVSKEKCEQRGCLWQLPQNPKVPTCYHSTIPSYTASNFQNLPTGMSLNLTLLPDALDPPPARATRRQTRASATNGLSDKIANLSVKVTYHTNTLLQLKIYDSDRTRYEVPIPLNTSSSTISSPENRLYDVSIQTNPFGIQIRRRSSQTVIWDSQLPGFTFNDMFLSISTRLPSQYIYGFGETNHETFRRNMNWHTWGMFARDGAAEDSNSYGVHPYYLALEECGSAHGVLLLNSNAMDVTLQPTPALTYRTTGGIFDFYVILGPTPEQVTQQYTELIGRPAMVPYWALGFQLGRDGYQDDKEISDLYEAMVAAGIPYDVQHLGRDYMERKLDFTLSTKFPGLLRLIKKMKNDGMRFIPVLDPAISGNETDYLPFIRGQEDKVFIQWPGSNDTVWGKAWPDLPNVINVNDSLDHETQVKLYRAHVAFPDFLCNNTVSWWKKEIRELYTNTGQPEKSLKFDGLWLDMNEPSNYVDGSVSGCRNLALNSPPYLPALESRDRGLSNKTLCMESQQVLADGSVVRHYDVHSLYGWSQTRPTYEAVQEVTKQRGVVITRSTFPSSGRWGGHWLGKNTARWDQLKKSIVGMMEFSLFGIPYTGADICGFSGDAEYEMCVRWVQLGAFYPLSRNHNSKGTRRQDPVSWNTTFEDISRSVLEIRYTLLPYLYTLMHLAHTEGSTVVRPLLHEFPQDNKTWDIDRQFMLGPALLISPVLENGTSQIDAYFPKARWYDYGTGSSQESTGEEKTLSASLDHINLHVRGGYILPWQEPANNTYTSRQKFMGLTVALDSNETAHGQLFWDDGQSINTFEKGTYFLVNFKATKNVLHIQTRHNRYLNDTNQLKVGYIKIWGLKSNYVRDVKVTHGDEQFTETNFTSDSHNQTLTIQLTNQTIYLEKLTNITWINDDPVVTTPPATSTFPPNSYCYSYYSSYYYYYYCKHAFFWPDNYYYSYYCYSQHNSF